MLSKPVTGTPIRWVAAAERVIIGDVNIDAGLFYLGQFRPDCQVAPIYERSCIDPSLPVAQAEPDFAGEQLGLWSSYGAMSPASRLAYLRWHAEGRKRRDIHITYILMYLQGLERRLILERSASDMHGGIVELCRLSELHGHQPEFRRVTKRIVETLALVFGGRQFMMPPDEDAVHSGVPITVKIEIGHRLAAGQSIDSDLLLAWVLGEGALRRQLAPGAALSSFRDHLRTVLPEGMVLEAVPAPQLQHCFCASSGDYTVRLDDLLPIVPDIGSMPQTLAQVRDRIESAYLLWRASSAIATESASAQLPVTELAAVETTLSASDANPLSRLGDWARTELARGGLISLSAALARFRNAQPKRIAAGEVARLADALALEGFGLVPDPRFLGPITVLGEDGILFRLNSKLETIGPASVAYEEVLTELLVCVAIAKSDSEFGRDEVELARRIIDRRTDLTNDEQARLDATVRWAGDRVLPAAPLFTAIESLPDARRHVIAGVAIETIFADGSINITESSFAQAIFSTLGLTAGDFDRSIRQQRFTAQRSTATPGIAPRIIATSLRELSPASQNSLLENASNQPDGNDTVNAFPGLDRKHARFMAALKTQSLWSRKALERLAREYRLMADGAIEVINEWLQDRVDEDLLLIEDDGSLRMTLDAELSMAGAA